MTQTESIPAWAMEMAEEKRLLKNWRGRRLLACRATDLLRNVIEAMEEDDGRYPHPDGKLPDQSPQERISLLHLTDTLRGMILIANDGGHGKRVPIKILNQEQNP